LLVSSLTTLTKTFEEVIERTRLDLKELELEEFLPWSNDDNHGILKLGAITPAYAECMKKVGVRKRAELEQLWTKFNDDFDVRSAVEGLLQAEKKFVEFTAEVEEEFSPLENKLTVKGTLKMGQMIPKNQTLIEVPSGQPLPLEECQKGARFTLFVLLRLFG